MLCCTQDYKSGYTALHFAVALNRANLIKCLSDKLDPSIESYAGKLACEIEDDDYEDEDVCTYLKISYSFIKLIFKHLLQLDDLVKSINVLQLPHTSSIKC